MSKALFAVTVLVGLLGPALVITDAARSLKGPTYTPYSAEEEASETPAYKAEESYTGKGLYPGEAYAPNVPSLIEAAAEVPAPEGAELIKIANSIAPAGVPEVGLAIDAAQKAGTSAGCSKLAAAEEAAPALKGQPQPALSPKDAAPPNP